MKRYVAPCVFGLAACTAFDATPAAPPVDPEAGTPAVTNDGGDPTPTDAGPDGNGQSCPEALAEPFSDTSALANWTVIDTPGPANSNGAVLIGRTSGIAGGPDGVFALAAGTNASSSTKLIDAFVHKFVPRVARRVQLDYDFAINPRVDPTTIPGCILGVARGTDFEVRIDILVTASGWLAHGFVTTPAGEILAGSESTASISIPAQGTWVHVKNELEVDAERRLTRVMTIGTERRQLAAFTLPAPTATPELDTIHPLCGLFGSHGTPTKVAGLLIKELHVTACGP